MKLLYLADIRFPMERANGIQTVQTCHALARAGVAVELVVRRSDERSDAECLQFFGLLPHPNLTLSRISGRGRPGFLAACVRRLVPRPDAIFTRDLLLADILLKLSQTPLIYEAHTVAAVFAEERTKLYQDSEVPKASKLRRLDKREARVCQRAAGIVSITRALAEELSARHQPVAPMTVIPDGCLVPSARPETPSGSSIFYVGQLYPWKGVDVLVDAVARMEEAELVIVGGLPPEPDLERLKALAAARGVSDRVEFRGFVPPHELEEATREAAIYVVPNLDSVTARLYTSPLKLFEAMASGRAVVASDLPSLREVLEPDVNAVLVPPGDVDALAGALQLLVGDKKLRQRLAARAFEDVSAYSWDARAASIRAFVESLSG